MAGRTYLPFLVVFAACASPLALGTSKCYDHQTQTYQSRFSPTYCKDTCSVTPFFSPDHSVDVYVDLIQSATEAVDIFTPGKPLCQCRHCNIAAYYKIMQRRLRSISFDVPYIFAGFDSWNYCTSYKTECDGECIGCTLEDQKNESFPVFPALLNAVHQKNIKVRIITNNFTQPTCEGKIAPFDWFYLNGIQVRFYTTTTFMHSKFVMVDYGKKTAVSSVNWSKTSFTRNREAGVVLEDCSCSVINFYKSVFEYDWGRSVDYVPDQTYTSDQLKYITDPSILPITIPTPSHINGAYVTPLNTYSDVSIKKGYTSPDNARDTVFSYFPKVKSSFQVSNSFDTESYMFSKLLVLFFVI